MACLRVLCSRKLLFLLWHVCGSCAPESCFAKLLDEVTGSHPLFAVFSGGALSRNAMQVYGTAGGVKPRPSAVCGEHRCLFLRKGSKKG